MPHFRTSPDIVLPARMQQGIKRGSLFNSLMAEYKPYLWIRGNDVPASGTLVDYGAPGPGVPPQYPPHSLSYPAHCSQVPGFTTDGQSGIGWDGVNTSQGAYVSPGGALDNQPQGTAWTFICGNRVPNGTATEVVVCSACAGTGLNTDGNSLLFFHVGSFGAGTAIIGCDYNGGSIAYHRVDDARFTDGQWHLYGLNVYPVGGVLGTVMNYDLYIDGALAYQFQVDSAGLSFFYGGGNFASIPDAFRIGGNPAWAGAANRKIGAVQHYALFIGGALSNFGPMLTAQQHAALWAGR